MWLWLVNNIGVSEIIAIIGITGGGIAGLVTLKDKAAARTITELRTIIEGIRIENDRLREAQTEYRAEAETHKEGEKIANNRADAAEERLSRLIAVVHVDGVPFLKKDNSPHYPVCPGCYKNGAITYMTLRRNYSAPFFACPIKECNTSIPIKQGSENHYINDDLEDSQ